jgi:GT2 family glycosyltransferase
MLNEVAHIERCLAGLRSQTYPQDHLSVVVVDGGSTDGSRELVDAIAAREPWLSVVDNPDRRASSAFNRGIEASSGEVVMLLSSHGEVGDDFVERSVDALRTSDAAGVGGALRHVGQDPVGAAIALAMTSPFGMASPFRYSTRRQAVDTIGHPAYWRSVLEEVGPFDERLERNSDYDLNQRIRSAGHELLFDPSIVTTYYPRASLRSLSKQFWWYGRWKAHAVRRQPRALRARHVVAPAVVATVVASPLLAMTRPGRIVLTVGAIGYLSILAGITVAARPRSRGASTATFVAAFPVMHGTWGAGFLTTLFLGWRR